MSGLRSLASMLLAKEPGKMKRGKVCLCGRGLDSPNSPRLLPMPLFLPSFLAYWRSMGIPWGCIKIQVLASVVVQAWNPSYSGGWGKRIAGLRPAWATYIGRMCLKNKTNKIIYTYSFIYMYIYIYMYVCTFDSEFLTGT
jgi:hypothetical protein